MNGYQNDNPPLPSNGNQAGVSTTDTNGNQNNNSPNGDQNDSPILSLFDVLVDEYERQVKTHGLKPLYIDDAAKTDNIDAQMKEARGQIEKKRAEVKKKYALLTDEKERERRINEDLVKDFYRRLHKSGQKRAALCFSGGGIRSATFGLGVIQGLVSRLDLGSFHYLSTVSGGGYLGSWLSAWIHRRGMDEVQRSLGGRRPQSAAPGRPSSNSEPEAIPQLNPEPDTIRHLRSYSNYMSPKLGLLSADTWTLGTIFARNLLLNWLVLIPLLLIALAIPRIGVAVVKLEHLNTFAPPMLFLVSLLTGIVAVAYVVANRPSLKGALSIRDERGVRDPADELDFLKWCLAPLLISAIAASTYWVWPKGADGGFGVFYVLLSGSTPDQSLLGGWFKSSVWPFCVLGVILHLVNALVSSLLAKRRLELVRNFVMGALSGSCIGLLVACPNVAIKRFVLFGIVFHYFGVLVAQLRLERLRLRDYVYAIFTGGLGGFSIWFVAYKVFPMPQAPDPAGGAIEFYTCLYVCFAASLFLLVFLLAATIFAGLASTFNSDADREWMARAGAWILIAIVVWGGLSSVVIFGPALLLSLGPELKVALGSLGVGSGVVTLLGGYSAKSASAKQNSPAKTKSSSLLPEIAPALAAPVFAVSILITLSLGTSWLIAKTPQVNIKHTPFSYYWHLDVIYQTPFWLLAAFVGAAAILSGVMGLCVNINKFSLHAAYRDRLIRAYLGASRSSEERQANPFTGLDEKDNLQMNELLTDLFYADQFTDEHLRDFIHRLKNDPNEADKRMSDLLLFEKGISKKASMGLIEQYSTILAGEENMSKHLVRRNLVDWLNRIIQREKLQDEQCFRKALADQPTALKNKINEMIPNQSATPNGRNSWREAAFDKTVSLLKNPLSSPPVIEQTRLNRLLLEANYPSLPKLEDSEKTPRPLHIVNMALNLVAGKELAWQDRKAETFTASLLHVGNFDLGYRDSRKYSVTRSQGQAFSLGTAMAISGAAASPNMGYHSSPIVTFLLAFFNVRLGWWLGNPGRKGNDSYAKPSPTFAPRPLIAETLGRTDNNHPYVYLSDGGHFENLGLYEMVLRRCHFIVVSDGSQDKDFDFESLGNAMSKIRTDLGVRITFDSIPISPREEKIPTFVKDRQEDKGKKYCAVGRIHYSEVDEMECDGFLLYIKPTLYGVEPADVQNYARANPAFPHESTGDQMYSETQFESYRALGFHEVSEIAPNSASKSKIELQEMFRQVYEEYFREDAPKDLR